MCAKQPNIAGRSRRQVWERALLCRPPGAVAGAPAPGVENSPTLRAAGRQACETALKHGQAGAATDPPMQVWETALHGGQLATQLMRRCWIWETALLAGRKATQLMRQRQVWETALLCGPPGTAAGAPASDVGNSPT